MPLPRGVDSYLARRALTLGGVWVAISFSGLGYILWDRHTTAFVGLYVDKHEKDQKGWTVAEVVGDSPARTAGVARGWLLVSLNGRKLDRFTLIPHSDQIDSLGQANRWLQWQKWLRRVTRPGKPVNLDFRTREGAPRQIRVVPEQTPFIWILSHNWLIILVGLVYAGLGFATVYLRPSSDPARKLLLFCLAVYTFNLISAGSELPRLLVMPGWGGWLFWVVQDGVFNLLGPALLHFCVSMLEIRTPRALFGSLYAASLGVTALLYFRVITVSTAVLFTVALMVASVGLLLWRYLSRQTEILRKKQIKWLLWGGGVPAGTLILFNLLVHLAGLGFSRQSVSQVHMVASLSFPLATFLAVRRQRLFDIDLVVRRSVVAMVMVPVALLVYALLVGTLSGAAAQANLPMLLLIAIVALVVLMPGQVRLEEAADRLLGLNRFAGRSALSELAASLARVDSLEEIARMVVTGAREALELANAALFLVDLEHRWLIPVAFAGRFDEAPSRIDAGFLDHPEISSDTVCYREVLKDSKTASALGMPQPALLLPVRTSTRVLGLLSIGSKAKKSVSGDEFKALKNVAGALAMAADRAIHLELLRKVQSMQAQMVQSGRMAALGTMAAGLAHELNTPLGYVKANAQLIERRLMAMAEADPDGTAASVLQLATDIREGAETMSEVVNNLRGFVQLDRRGLMMVDINTCVRQTLKLLKRAIPQGVEIETDLADVPGFPAHAAQLNQVLVNLIQNACDAMDGKGKMDVSTRVVGATVQVKVTDHGKGLSREALDRVFDPFYTTKPVGKGMGLGLAISRTVVEGHKGRLELANRKDGVQGAEAVMILPLNGTLGSEDQ